MTEQDDPQPQEDPGDGGDGGGAVEYAGQCESKCPTEAYQCILGIRHGADGLKHDCGTHKWGSGDV
jgi:hypothetical protein